MSYTARPLTPDEKIRLRGWTRQSILPVLIRAYIFGFFLLSAVLFVLLFNAWKWLGGQLGFHQAPQQQGLFVLISCTFAALFIVKMTWNRRQAEKRRAATGGASFTATMDKAAADLAGGVAHVEELSLTAAIEIEEYEDEGAGFLLELSDDRVLCVIGQDLYDYAHDVIIEPDAPPVRPYGIFPATKITYSYAPTSGIRLDMTGDGTAMHVSGSVKSARDFFKKDKNGVRYYAGPEDGGFYPGTLEAVLKKFGFKIDPLPNPGTTTA